MKIILTILVTIFVASCAHHHTTPEHHHHAYDKHCAYSVAHGDLKTKGITEYKVEHGDSVYYFSSKEKLNEFNKDIKTSIRRANQNWQNRNRR